MKIEKDTPVRLKSFLGTLTSSEKVNENENYWKLIGETGRVIENENIKNGRVLVLFKNNLNDYNLENHNQINNSLWLKKSDLELDNYGIHIKKLNKEISKRTSFMSNTKWFKLFTKIEENKFDIQSAYIKFLLEDRKYKFRFGGFDTTGFGDVSAIGPFKFKEIEWILIPEKHEIERWNRNEKLTSEIISQPLIEIKKIMTSLGHFEYDKTEDELKIYGYK
ncbi:DUF6678 family protein [Olleya sp. R77988]|uniref:DUF6678 family protein n=1 Tax=Olleya sp. R77988 TaxID=3093875 RepID=UPI0037C9D57A